MSKKENSMMKRRGLAAIAIMFGIMLFSLVTMPTQAKVVQNLKIPIETDIYNAGAGEWIHITGEGHLLLTSTADNNGGLHVVMNANFQGYVGIGSISGDKYQITGGNTIQMNFKPPFPAEQSFLSFLNVVGPGRGNNMQTSMHVHVTVNANGDATATVSTLRIVSK
jgi:hypothetical protein